MKILIAEDDQTLQILNRAFMDDWGFEFDMVSNGVEAVRYAQKNEGKYDLCLMDIEMPIMNGLDATKLIRQKVKYFPIAALTANSDYKMESVKVGMDDFLQKPFYSEQLYSLISELSVKALKLVLERNQIYLMKELPMDSNELKELRELDKKGLTKFSLIGTEYKFVVHKNLQNKISYDFIAKGKQLSEFLDRSENEPGIIHLYASNLHANKRHILPEFYEQLSQEEDKELEKYTTRSEYPDKEDLNKP